MMLRHPFLVATTRGGWWEGVQHVSMHANFSEVVEDVLLTYAPFLATSWHQI